MAKGLKKIQGFKLINQTSSFANELFVSQEILKEHNKITYEKINEAFDYAQSVAVSQATGTGKSFLAIKWLADKLKDGQTALYLAPNENIANQFKKHIKILGLAEKLKDVKFVLYPSLQTEVDAMLESSTNLDYIVADEFHRLGATTWNPAYLELIENNPEALVLGLSATPIRFLDGERDMAEELFEETVEGLNLVDAIKQGIIPTPNYVQGVISYSAQIDQLEKRLNYVKDEKSRSEIEKEIKKLKRNIEQAGGLEELFGEYIEKKDGKYVLFCSDLNHLLEIKDKIENGLFSKVNSKVKVYDVSYKKTESQVEREIDKFEKDEGEELKIMLSVEMLNEGVHIKGLDGAIMMRKTISPRIYLQQLGRVLAVGGKEKPLVIDVVENYESLEFLGSYFSDNEYEGEGRGEEFVLPFEVKGRSVEIDKFIKNVEDLMYKSTGTHGWLALARDYAKVHGNLNISKSTMNDGFYKSLYVWLSVKKRLFRKNPDDQKNKWVFEELAKIDINWHKDRWSGNKDYQIKKLEECREFYKRNGHLEIPSNVELYRWITVRKREFVKKHANHQWIFDELSSMDPNWHKDRSKANFDFIEKRLQETIDFYNQNGNFNIPIKLPDGSKNVLYQWFNIRKREFREDRKNLNYTKVYDTLTLMDPYWYKDNSKGNKEFQLDMINQLKEYYDKNGDFNLPMRLDNGDRNALYAWMMNRRREYKINPSDEKNKWIFDILSSIDPNWYKAEKEALQEQRIREIKEYFIKNGNFDIPSNLEDVKYNTLYYWFNSIKKEYRKNPEDQKNKWIFKELSLLDPNWHKDRSPGNNDFQEERLQELIDFYKQNGNFEIPSVSYDGSRGLRQWFTLRKKEFREGKKNPKFLIVYETLSSIDPNWHEDRSYGSQKYHEENLGNCKKYYLENGNFNIPIKFVDGKVNPLYTWFNSRRQEYRNNPKDHKNQWIFEELADLDENWYKNNSKGNKDYQEKRINECKEYYSVYGNLNISQMSNQALYQWIKSRRNEYKNDPNDEKNKWIFEELQKITPYWFMNTREYNAMLDENIEKE